MDANRSNGVDPLDAAYLSDLNAAMRRWGSNIDGLVRSPGSSQIEAAVQAAESQVRANWAGLSDGFKAAHPDLAGAWSSFERGDMAGVFARAVMRLTDDLARG